MKNFKHLKVFIKKISVHSGLEIIIFSRISLNVSARHGQRSSTLGGQGVYDSFWPIFARGYQGIQFCPKFPRNHQKICRSKLRPPVCQFFRRQGGFRLIPLWPSLVWTKCLIFQFQTKLKKDWKSKNIFVSNIYTKKMNEKVNEKNFYLWL